VIIDARRHDAVLFTIGSEVSDAEPNARGDLCGTLRLHGLAADELSRDRRLDAAFFDEAARRLNTRPGRSVLVTDSEDAVAAARRSGFALIVGIDRAGAGEALRRQGADVVVPRIHDISVRALNRRMSQLPDAAVLFDGPATMLGDGKPAVFYDFDGTLSDIVADPDTAALTAGAADALRSLTEQCPVAVLSGRDLADVRQRIGLPGIWYAGSHGFESVGPDGSHHQNDAAAPAIAVLEEAAAELRDRLANISGVAVEHKRFGVAVHYRNAERNRVGEVLSAVREAGQRTGLRITTGREVIELRPDVDWDKGKTLRWVLDQISGVGSAALLPVYLGDDITDEDAFDAIEDDGLGIVVRHNDDGDRATAARYALENPAQVSEFTGRLARQLAVNS
jgi:trehalose 6-phosphate phosphatase